MSKTIEEIEHALTGPVQHLINHLEAGGAITGRNDNKLEPEFQYRLIDNKLKYINLSDTPATWKNAYWVTDGTAPYIIWIEQYINILNLEISDDED